MKPWKFIRSKIIIRRSVILLTALLLVAGLVSTQAVNPALGMRRDDPTGTDPVGPGGDPPPFTVPADGFTWSMEKRFGPDRNLDGMIDYNWDSVSMTYDQAYVFPSAWKVTFDGCQTPGDHTNPTATTYTYSWLLDGASMTSGKKCIVTKSFTEQASHTVRLTVLDENNNDIVFPNGRTYVDQTVTIKDYFIVSIGDSYGSGQGNPDIPLTATPLVFGIGWIQNTPAQWEDERCSRSSYAGPAQAALALEAADPHSSVTFISFNCSGASINTPRYDDNDPNKNAGTGVLGPYRGEVTDIPYSNTFVGYIPSQIDQLTAALVPPSGKSPRQIDALIISAGGNDMHFGSVVQACVENLDCWNNPIVRLKEDAHDTVSWNLYDLIDRALGRWENGPVNNLPHNYDLLGAAINALSPRPVNVYITQYPDPTIADDGEHCRMLDDIAWPNPYYQVAIPESTVASHYVMPGLNSTVRDSVARLASAYTNIHWQFVDGLTVYDVDPNPAFPPGTPGLFVGGPNGPGHGYCASDNWIRRADESELIQGPVNFRNLTKGLMHPNASGHQAYKERILRYMLPDLGVQSPQPPPTFSFSFSSGGLTSQPGLNGWYIRSCDSNNTCQPKVVAQAVAHSTIALNGASILLNDASGCSGGVVCGITASTDAKQITYSVIISASGTYHFQFNVQDTSGQVAFLQQEIKVDLDDPVLSTPIGPFEVAEGGSVEVSASMATNSDGVPLNDDVLVDYDWDLDNNGTFETTGEQPSFSAAQLDGPSSETIQVRVTDRAGRTSVGQATVNVSNVAPALSSVSGPAAGVYEATSFTLTGDITDPATADAFSLTIDWGDGSLDDVVSLDAGSTGFSQSHTYADDDPTGTASDAYPVTLSIEDDDGDTGAGSASLVVTNLAPTVAITAPQNGALYGLNAAVNLSASLADKSALDTLTCSLNWGDGVTGPGALAAGVCSGSHAYSTAGVYTVQVTGTDDDTGSMTGDLMVVVYDPSAGFVTGGGWIASPAGAYKADESLAGKASFGFVSKYQKGANLPTGTTAFEFDLAGLAFSSQSYEWLVVNQAGTNAQFKGSGTVNGLLDPNGKAYKFVLWAGDGSADTFRIRIWWEDAAGEHVVYGNGFNQSIGGGNIVIHTSK